MASRRAPKEPCAAHEGLKRPLTKPEASPWNFDISAEEAERFVYIAGGPQRMQQMFADLTDSLRRRLADGLTESAVQAAQEALSGHPEEDSEDDDAWVALPEEPVEAAIATAEADPMEGKTDPMEDTAEAAVAEQRPPNGTLRRHPPEVPSADQQTHPSASDDALPDNLHVEGGSQDGERPRRKAGKKRKSRKKRGPQSQSGSQDEDVSTSHEALEAMRLQPAELHSRILRKFLNFEGGPKRNIDKRSKFSRFCRFMLDQDTPSSRACFKRWVELPEAYDFIHNRVGFTLGAVGLIRNFVKTVPSGKSVVDSPPWRMLVEGAMPQTTPITINELKATVEASDFLETGKLSGDDLHAPDALTKKGLVVQPNLLATGLGFVGGWTPGSLFAQLRSLGLSNFDFSIPPNFNNLTEEVTQVIAHILVKARTFEVACLTENKTSWRQMRFRAVVAGGKRHLEARFLGSVEKYPMLQPWFLHKATRTVMFFGREGVVASDYKRDLNDPLSHVSGATPMPGAFAFGVGMRFAAPVLLLQEVFEDALLQEECYGAVTRARAGEYGSFLLNEQEEPFNIIDFVHYLKKGTGPTYDTRK